MGEVRLGLCRRWGVPCVGGLSQGGGGVGMGWRKSGVSRDSVQVLNRVEDMLQGG